MRTSRIGTEASRTALYGILLIANSSCDPWTPGSGTCNPWVLTLDYNTTPVDDDAPPVDQRRILQPGDTWIYDFNTNVFDYWWSWVYHGTAEAVVEQVTVPDFNGTQVRVLTWTGTQIDCESETEVLSRSQHFFTQDENGLLWVHGESGNLELGESSYMVADPEMGRYIRTPAHPVVGDELHGEVVFDDGRILFFDDRVTAVEDVETGIGVLRSFRIERVSSYSWNGRVDRLVEETDWFAPEIGQFVRTRIVETIIPEDGYVATWVSLYELSDTSVVPTNVVLPDEPKFGDRTPRPPGR